MHSNIPKVSVIVPVYNTYPDFIRQAMTSLFKQTLENIEIIIVNDGSTRKDTISFLEKLRECERIVYIGLAKNTGLAHARNVGLQAAKGEYVGFLDSDDWLDNNFYEKLYNNCKHNNCDVGCGILRLCKGDDCTYLDRHPVMIATNIKTKLEYITNGSVCTKLFKRDLFDGVTFPNGRFYEDNIVLLQILLKSNRVFFCDSVFYNYRVNPTSIIHNPDNNDKRVDDDVYILEKIHNIAIKQNKKEKDVIIETFLKILFLPNEYAKESIYYLEINRIFGKENIHKIMVREKASGPKNRHSLCVKIFNLLNVFNFKTKRDFL